MKLKYTILYVENVKQSLQFFEKAFGLNIQFIHESGDYGEINTGQTTLSFSSKKLMTELGKLPGTPDPKRPVFEIAFETDDVAAAVKNALDAGAKLEQEVRDEPWGQTTAYVSDCNGYLIEICSPVTSAS
ncbi:MAG: VOC family protein [Rickettsiales bacterium]|nr:VOC family protein [Rickettsiales bacterium]